MHDNGEVALCPPSRTRARRARNPQMARPPSRVSRFKIHPGRSMSSAAKLGEPRRPSAPEASTAARVVIAPRPGRRSISGRGAKTSCVGHFSGNAIFAPAACGPKPRLRGPGIYTAPSHGHLLCEVVRVSRNAPVLYPLRGRFWFSWKSGNPAPSHFSQSVSSVQFSSVQLCRGTGRHNNPNY